MKKRLFEFINNEKVSPVLAGVTAGLYPMLYYYNSNFTIVNSWEHLFYFCLAYLLLPLLTFSLIYFIFKKLVVLKKYKDYVLPTLNLCVFTFFIIISTLGFHKKKLVVALFVAFLLAVIFKKYLKKIIILQLLMAAMVSAMLLPDIYWQIFYKTKWMNHDDDIEKVVFKKQPNIYVIQPDGYVNFSELKKGYYNIDNSNFETFLKENHFKLYETRSNYYSTLSSNCSMFTMKQHKFNKLEYGLGRELLNARQIITGKNSVVSILKKNNYKTNLLLEHPYLIVNKPKIAYDYCNISSSDFSFLSRGLKLKKDIKEDLVYAIDNAKEKKSFYFIEKMKPSHITSMKIYSTGVEQERQNYINNLKEANDWLKEIITIINEKDKNALIVMVSDHGGFVGMEYTGESSKKSLDRDLIYSIFSTAVAIKWPGEIPEFDDKIETNVNLFRVLFSYLSEDEKYLDNLEEDKSYLVIKEGAPIGVYEVVNENGEVVFEPIEE